jgi:uncharacterized protein (TIGR00251 family)
MEIEDAVTATPEGARVAVKAQPRAKRDAVVGVIDDGRGGAAVKIAVSAPPVEGAANEAIERLLASTIGVARSLVRVDKGASGRAKLVEVRGVSREVVVAALRAATR